MYTGNAFCSSSSASKLYNPLIKCKKYLKFSLPQQRRSQEIIRCVLLPYQISCWCHRIFLCQSTWTRSIRFHNTLFFGLDRQKKTKKKTGVPNCYTYYIYWEMKTLEGPDLGQVCQYWVLYMCVTFGTEVCNESRSHWDPRDPTQITLEQAVSR